jgi:hypothetical protein
MVTIITEKLQNQKLEDVTVDSVPVPIPQSSGNTWTFATSSSAFKLTGTSGWATTLFVDSTDDGKWRIAEKKPAVATQAPSFITTTSARHSSHAHFLTQYTAKCDVLANTPPAPPTKRHCRSLSIPGDGNNNTRRWQPQASSVWRPVALRSHHHHNNNNRLKNRNSPLGLHRPPPCTSPLLGQVATSITLRPLSKSEDFNFTTPPDSPVPRPASAAGVYYDSSGWLETSPYRIRSQSIDEHFACGLAESTNSKVTGSMPVIPGSGQAASSTPSSPGSLQRVPRCRSQPCVLHERKCLKRRRDEERPALDFRKMKETAYEPRGRRYSGTHFEFIRSSRSLASFFTESPECVLGLNTIASSPLDSTLPNSLSNTTTPTADKPCISILSSLATPKDNRDDVQFDSGCSDTAEIGTDRSESTTFADSETEENSCSCDDVVDGPMFDLEMNNDLDIDQIEKD